MGTQQKKNSSRMWTGIGRNPLEWGVYGKVLGSMGSMDERTRRRELRRMLCENFSAEYHGEYKHMREFMRVLPISLYDIGFYGIWGEETGF